MSIYMELKKSTMISIGPWVSSRTYFTADQTRSIIINERSRDLYTLDEESASLWARLEQGATAEDLHAHAIELGVESELDDFMLSLSQMDLLSSNVHGTPPPARARAVTKH